VILSLINLICQILAYRTNLICQILAYAKFWPIEQTYRTQNLLKLSAIFWDSKVVLFSLILSLDGAIVTRNCSVAYYDVNIFLRNITSIFSLNVNVEIAQYVIFFG